MKINMMKHSLAIIKNCLINALDNAEQIYYAVDLFNDEETKKEAAVKGYEHLEYWINKAGEILKELKKETYEED